MKQNGKKAILVVSFGTSYQETREKTIGAIERDIAGTFPDWEVRRAFTSGMILKKLRDRDKLTIDNVAEALERLASDGFETVVCQPTHILNGEEYDDIVAAVELFRARFRAVRIGAPLLSTTEDYIQLVRIISELFSPEARTAVCLMGHGSTHFADSAYAALDYHFKEQGRSDIFVGTVEGYPDLDTLLRHVQAFGASRAVLTPLMVVAGDHAINDMASDEEDSWKTAFTDAGLEVRCVLRGLGEYAGIRGMYTGHTDAVIRSLTD